MKFFDRFIGKNKVKGVTGDKETPVKENLGSASSEEDYVSPQYDRISYSTIQQLYDNSNLLKKYIKVITDECIRYQLIAVPTKKSSRAKKRAQELNQLFVKSNKLETFSEVREKYLKDLYLYGRAGIEIQPDAKPEVDAIYAVPGYCIRLNVDDTGSNFKNEKEAYQILDPNDIGTVASVLPYDSMIYFVLDKMSDRVYGSSPIQSIYQELMADLQSTKNLAAGTNSIKAGVLCLPKAPRRLLQDVVSRLTILVKKNARTKITAVNNEGTFLDLSNLSPKDNIELQKWLVHKANIYNIPSFMLDMSQDSGGLNAREQKDDFRALIEGIVKYEINKLNAILIRTKLGYDDVEIVCPDFSSNLSYQRTRIAVRLVNGNIVTPNEARQTYLGLPPIDSPSADMLASDAEAQRAKDAAAANPQADTSSSSPDQDGE